jgi:uncharacterized protein with von Willebrand factor type A (vWA) domain
MALGTSELLDAFAALDHVSWSERASFKEALAATLAKSPEDRRLFELVFERFFFRAAEAEATRHEISEHGAVQGGDQIDLEALRREIAAALRDGSEGALGDLARLALAAARAQGWSGSMSSAFAARSGSGPSHSRTCPTATRGAMDSPASRSAISSLTCGASSNAPPSNAPARSHPNVP